MAARKPLCIDLFCGLGGWAEGFLAEGYDVIGFDIERHRYLVTESHFGGLPKTRSLQYPAQLVLQDVRTLHGSQFRDATIIVASPPCQEFSYWHQFSWKAPDPKLGIELFNECARIRREAYYGYGYRDSSHLHTLPLIVENVIGAQRWVGSAKWHYGSFYLWGDVPALMPIGAPIKGFKKDQSTTPSAKFSSKSPERKAWSAQKIPFELARHIARVYKPPVEKSA